MTSGGDKIIGADTAKAKVTVDQSVSPQFHAQLKQ